MSSSIRQESLYTDWEHLAKKLGTLNEDGSESGGNSSAEEALEDILGDEWAKSTVEYILSYKKGSELAMNCLQLIHSKKAALYSYNLYKSSTNSDRSDRAVWLIKHLAHPISLQWIEEFLKDKNVCHRGVEVLDRLIWEERIQVDSYTQSLLDKAEIIAPSLVQFIREYLQECKTIN